MRDRGSINRAGETGHRETHFVSTGRVPTHAELPTVTVPRKGSSDRFKGNSEERVGKHSRRMDWCRRASWWTYAGNIVRAWDSLIRPSQSAVSAIIDTVAVKRKKTGDSDNIAKFPAGNLPCITSDFTFEFIVFQ